jgi:quinohemoprotein ethanol dehydrogenase
MCRPRQSGNQLLALNATYEGRVRDDWQPARAPKKPDTHAAISGSPWSTTGGSGAPSCAKLGSQNPQANAAFQNPWPTQPESSIESLTAHQATGLPAGYTAASYGTTPGPRPVVFQPWALGGMEWPPAAYSPRTGFIYSHARYSPIAVTSSNDCPADPTSAVCGFTYAFPPGVQQGVYGAVNPVTGKVAWTVALLAIAPDSGVSVTGDLVFFGDGTGLFCAASAATGEILWVFDAATEPNAGGATACAAVYEIDGVEYVVYGFGGNPSYSFTLGDAVIAFALPSAITAPAAKAKAK